MFLEILYFTSRRSEKENKGQETGKNGRNRGKHVKLGEKKEKDRENWSQWNERERNGTKCRPKAYY